MLCPYSKLIHLTNIITITFVDDWNTARPLLKKAKDDSNLETETKNTSISRRRKIKILQRYSPNQSDAGIEDEDDNEKEDDENDRMEGDFQLQLDESNVFGEPNT